MARPLVRANALLFALLLMHIADHVRQDRSLPAPASTAGLLGQAFVALALVLAVSDHPLAPDAAIAAGFGTAAGFVLVHALPNVLGAFSDSYAAAHVDALSWIQAALCVAAALWLGVEGVRARAVPFRAAAR